MALINQAGMYNGSAPLNPLPYVNIALQQRARKQAREEAVNQYYHKLGDSLNTAGVRKQDLGYDDKQGILKEINDWKTKAIQHKDQAKSNPYFQQELMSDYQNILRKVELSKARGKLELEMGKAKFEGTYDPDDDDLHVIDKISKSIYDPASYKEDGVSEYGWGDTNKAVGDFDPNKQNAFFKSAIGANKLTYDESKARIDNVTGDIFIPQKYSEKQIKAIADNAGNIFEGSREAKKHYNKLLYDPAFINDANEAYQSVYGKDKMINTPKELAKADAIMRLNDQEAEVKVTDPNYKQKLQFDLIARRGQETRRNQLSAFRYALARQENAANLGLTAAQSPPNILDEYTTEYGEVFTEPLGGNKLLIVDAKNIDKQYKNLLGARPITVQGRSIYVVNEDGTWTGDDNKKINPVAVADDYTKLFGNTKFKIQSRKNFIDNENKKPTKKTATTNKWDKYKKN